MASKAVVEVRVRVTPLPLVIKMCTSATDTQPRPESRPPSLSWLLVWLLRVWRVRRWGWMCVTRRSRHSSPASAENVVEYDGENHEEDHAEKCISRTVTLAAYIHHRVFKCAGSCVYERNILLLATLLTTQYIVRRPVLLPPLAIHSHLPQFEIGGQGGRAAPLHRMRVGVPSPVFAMYALGCVLGACATSLLVEALQLRDGWQTSPCCHLIRFEIQTGYLR